MVVSVAESCIQANRKAVKELRPPANKGDASSNKSNRDELEICDLTMGESDCFHLFGDYPSQKVAECEVGTTLAKNEVLRLYEARESPIPDFDGIPGLS
jgi:hypothetical protein